MVFQTMLEVSNPFDVIVRNLGDAVVLFLIQGSISSNPQFIVRLYKSGEIRQVDMLDLVALGNPGDSRDGTGIPDKPRRWTADVM